jgi:RNA polymerase subunit RPABC4/transcription elongation factor Spt4
MFFFIGGVQPKTVKLEDHPRMCPACGLLQAYLQRVDHFLSIFFIPLLRVKKGEPMLACRSCGQVSRRAEKTPGDDLRRMSAATCPRCGRSIDPEFKYCPYCGQSQSR